MRCGLGCFWISVLSFAANVLPAVGEDEVALVQQTIAVAQHQALPPVPASRPRPYQEHDRRLLQHPLGGSPGAGPRAKAEGQRLLQRPLGGSPGPRPRAEAATSAATAAGHLFTSAGESGRGEGNCSAEERDQVLRSLRAISEGTSIADSVCHTVVEGDLCFGDTMWAMTEGFAAQPGLYVGLKQSSSLEEFQMYLYKIGHAHCPKACMSRAGAAAAERIPSRRGHAAEAPAADAKGEVVFASMPKSCTLDMTLTYGVNFEQFESCLQTLLHLSTPCSTCASDFLRAFVGEDIFHMRGVCLPRCRPMAAACQFGSDFGASVQALSGDCLEKAADCMDCVKPSVQDFLKCAGYPNREQVQEATSLLIEDFRSHSIVYPGHLNEVIQLALKGGF